MNINTAHQLMGLAARLIEASATFQAIYGEYYTLKPGSPEEAWKLYNHTFELQCEIGHLLDEFALTDMHHRYGAWWERQDVIDIAVAQALSFEVAHLIACCAHYEAQKPEWSYAVRNAQFAIAGMLHPSAIQVAMDRAIRTAS